MCHESWMRWERRRQARFDEELREVLDERERPQPPTPVAEREPRERQAEEETEVGTPA